MTTDGTEPPATNNLSDGAMLNVYLFTGGTKVKTAPFSIPSPEADLFLPQSKIVDINQADLVAFMGQLLANYRISDGESIAGNLGVNGVLDGHWFSKRRQ